MIRHILALLVFTFVGCNDWPPDKMYAPVDVPTEAAAIHQWIAPILSCDVAGTRRHVNERLRSDDPALAPILKRMSEYIPCQIGYSSGVGHVRCVRRYKDAETGRIAYDAIYVAQPLDNDLLDNKLNYFEQSQSCYKSLGVNACLR